MSETYDLRPGELLLRLKDGPQRQLVSSRFLTDAVGRLNRIGLVRDTDYILEANVARDIAIEYGSTELVLGGRGPLPQVFAHQDGAAALDWTGQTRMPSRAERIQRLIERHDLGRPTLAEQVTRLMNEAGFEEQAAAEVVRRMYDEAVAGQRAYHEPWGPRGR